MLIAKGGIDKDSWGSHPTDGMEKTKIVAIFFPSVFTGKVCFYFYVCIDILCNEEQGSTGLEGP